MYVTDNATFTFDVGFTSVRPVIPDQHHAFVTLTGEDSTTGFLAARRAAIAMVSGHQRNEMVTSATLVDAAI
jgi:hypothetical protein